MKISEVKNVRRERRTKSVRRHLRETGCGVRLSVYRSSKHIYAQVIDDNKGGTVCGLGTTAKSLADELAGKTKTERAAIIGKEIAKRAQEAGVQKVVFDRGPFKYHGRVKALADAARAEGLKF